MWENRNSILHDQEHLWKRQQREAWNEEVALYFNYYKDNQFLPRDSRYFKQGETTVLGYPDDLKEQWLEAVRYAEVRKTRHEEKEQRRRTRESILNWLIREEDGESA